MASTHKVPITMAIRFHGSWDCMRIDIVSLCVDAVEPRDNQGSPKLARPHPNHCPNSKLDATPRVGETIPNSAYESATRPPTILSYCCRPPRVKQKSPP